MSIKKVLDGIISRKMKGQAEIAGLSLTTLVKILGVVIFVILMILFLPGILEGASAGFKDLWGN